MNDVDKQHVDIDIALLALAHRITLSQVDDERYADIELFSPNIANIVDLDMEMIGNAIDYAEQETAKIVSLIH